TVMGFAAASTFLLASEAAASCVVAVHFAVPGLLSTTGAGGEADAAGAAWVESAAPATRAARTRHAPASTATTAASNRSLFIAPSLSRGPASSAARRRSPDRPSSARGHFLGLTRLDGRSRRDVVVEPSRVRDRDEAQSAQQAHGDDGAVAGPAVDGDRPLAVELDRSVGERRERDVRSARHVARQV